MCNSKGSVKSDNTKCTDKCCNNDGTCTCMPGYNGKNCQNCTEGYFISDVVDGDKICSGEYID